MGALWGGAGTVGQRLLRTLGAGAMLYLPEETGAGEVPVTSLRAAGVSEFLNRGNLASIQGQSRLGCYPMGSSS